MLTAPTAASAIDLRAVEALCRGDKAGLVVLHDRYHTAMVRLARRYVPDQDAAEEVTQDTWLEILRGIDRFEARCAPKTWVFRILTNRAKTRGTRDRRCVPFSALDGQGEGASESSVDVDRFSRDGRWTSQPASPDGLPEERLLSAETRTRILTAVDALPPAQRDVITLRDIKGWGPMKCASRLASTRRTNACSCTARGSGYAAPWNSTWGTPSTASDDHRISTWP